MELYSYSKYKGYHLYVEYLESFDDGFAFYEGCAYHNGTEMFRSKSIISGDKAEDTLKVLIDRYIKQEEVK